MMNELDLLLVPYFIVLGIYLVLGPKFPRMRGLTLVLMSNVCYLAVILIGCCSLASSYCWLLIVFWWLLLVTGGYCSVLLLV